MNLDIFSDDDDDIDQESHKVIYPSKQINK